MPEIEFVIETPSGVPNQRQYLVIPEEGELPEIPFQWDGETAHRWVLTSGAWRTWEGDRKYPAVGAGNCSLVWIEERKEWIAYAEHRERLPAGWYSDETLDLFGPWHLNHSYIRALQKAYPKAKDLLPEIAVRLSPEALENL